jgi:hypothetical protein
MTGEGTDSIIRGIAASQEPKPACSRLLLGTCNCTAYCGPYLEKVGPLRNRPRITGESLKGMDMVALEYLRNDLHVELAAVYDAMQRARTEQSARQRAERQAATEAQANAARPLDASDA